MEAENSDLFDRKLMSLYGAKTEQPTKMDIAGANSKRVQEE